jgi:sulfite exporter TauE/SafE
MIAALTGLLAGVVHVLSGPDHLTAIAPLAAHQRKGAWVPGLRWGIGHFAGVAAVGLLSLWLRDRLPVSLLSSWGDRVVGVVLFAVGLWAVRCALREKLHAHEHEHEGERHVHVHVHPDRVEHTQPTAHRHTHAAFAIGTLHGFAGSAHFLGILPMLALPTRLQAISYLLAFGVGTVLAMAMFAYGMGMVATRCQVTGARFYRGMMSTCGAAAMVIGAFWVSGYAW